MRGNTPPVMLLQLLPFIFNSKTLYVLGAGVSAKYIRPEYNLYEKTKDKLIEWAISSMLTPVQNIQLSESERHRFKIQGSKHIIHETIDGKLLIKETNMDFRDEILHSNPAILELVSALTYSISNIPNHCPEYQIFNLANSGSVIANMNYDCLATSFINKKINIIPLHGTMSQTTRNTIQKHTAHILEYDMGRFFLKNMIIATKENEHILHLNVYKKFISELEKNDFKYLVIIGYSFFKKDDNDIYDIVTYDLIRSYLYERNCKIIIIDLNTDYVADILSKTMGYPNILPLNIHWGGFTHAFVLANKVKSGPLWRFSSTDIFRFLKYYYYLEKINPDNFLATKPYFGKAHDL
jgi:hypothetical protein